MGWCTMCSIYGSTFFYKYCNLSTVDVLYMYVADHYYNHRPTSADGSYFPSNYVGLLCSQKTVSVKSRGKSGYKGRLSSQENWLVVKRQLFAAMMSPATHIMHNKSDDPNFSTLMARKVFVRPISPDKFSLRWVIRTTHTGDTIWVY